MTTPKFLIVASIFLIVQIVRAYDDDLDPIESSNVYEKIAGPDKFQYRNLDNQQMKIEQSSNPRAKQTQQSQSYFSSASSSSGNNGYSNGGNTNVNNKPRGHHFSSGNEQSSSSEYSEKYERKEGRGGDPGRDSRIEGRVTERERESSQLPSGRVETSRGDSHGRVETRGEGQGLPSRLEARGEGGHGRAEPRVTESRDYGRIEGREDSESVGESAKPSSSSPLLEVAESQQQQQVVQLLPRVSLRHDGAQRECKKCGGFSLGAVGGCCKSCAKLGYNKGCWCRSCDCLCYDA